MRSTPQKRWKIQRYDGPPLDYGKYDLRDFVPKNHWVILATKPNEAQLRCPECGYFLSLSIKKVHTYHKHTISEDGTVTPSIGHPSCGFHEWGVLEDWKLSVPVM